MFKRFIFLSCFIFVLGLVMSNTAGAQSANIVGWWKLDDIEGNIAIDSSGNELHGTLSEPESPEWMAGINGGSLFIELGEYVDLGNPDLLNFGTTDFTLCAWINTTAPGQGEDNICPIICNGGDWTGGIRYAMTINEVDAGAVTISLDDDVTKVVATSSGRVNDGIWHHIAVVKTSTSVAIYIDGAQDGINEGIPAGYDLSGTVQYNAYLGTVTDNRDGLLHKFFRDGRIDDARIFDAALSADELQAVMAFNMRGDATLAWKPSPVSGETEAPLDAVLGWLAGDGAEAHNVYFGTVLEDVTAASTDNPLDVLVAQNTADTSYTPGPLEYGQTYHWRVDEISGADILKGDVWTFTALNYPIVIEDFENYGDYPPDEIWMTWIDGYENPNNGASAGYPDPMFDDGEHYLENSIVHSGNWALPLIYDNVAGLSEVTRTLESPLSDMTREGVVTLTLFYLGKLDNIPEQMFVALDNAVVNNDDADAALAIDWTRWDIPLQSFTDQGVNLANVGSIAIGFGSRANPIPAGEDDRNGIVFFDDIRLYRE